MIEHALAAAHRQPHPLLLEIEQHALHESVSVVPRETGRLLSTLVHAMQANRVLEIGTGFGYATLWIALALPPAGRLWTVDVDRRRLEIARRYLDRAGRGEAVEMLTQPAREVFAQLRGRALDIVVLDTPDEDEVALIEAAVPLLKLSGLLVVNRIAPDGAATSAARTLLGHPDLDATIVPLGDGVGLGARVR